MIVSSLARESRSSSGTPYRKRPHSSELRAFLLGASGKELPYHPAPSACHAARSRSLQVKTGLLLTWQSYAHEAMRCNGRWCFTENPKGTGRQERRQGKGVLPELPPLFFALLENLAGSLGPLAEAAVFIPGEKFGVFLVFAKNAGAIPSIFFAHSPPDPAAVFCVFSDAGIRRCHALQRKNWRSGRGW